MPIQLPLTRDEYVARAMLLGMKYYMPHIIMPEHSGVMGDQWRELPMLDPDTMERLDTSQPAMTERWEKYREVRYSDGTVM